MWKKMVISLIALIGTLSVVYAMNNDISAQNNTYNAGGKVTGRIGDLRKGDRISLYTEKYTMQLVNNSIVGNPDTFWYAMSTKVDDTVDIIYDAINAKDAYGNSCPWDLAAKADMKNNSFECSNLRAKVDSANNSLDMRDYELISNRIVFKYNSETHTQESDSCLTDYCYKYTQIYQGNINKLFIPIYSEMHFNNANILSAVSLTDRDFSVPWIIGSLNSSAASTWVVFDKGEVSVKDISTSAYIRYSAYLNLENVVFSVSQGTNEALNKISAPKERSPLYQSDGEIMKVRFLSSSLKVNLIDILDKSNNKISKIKKGSTIYLKVEANEHIEADGVSTISAVIYGENGDFAYYKPLSTTIDGENLYALDTSDFEIGEYSVSVVNEIYNDSTMAPSKSSKISSPIPLGIVEGHTITYAKAPESGAILGDYEYDKNVDGGQKIGTISYDGKGVAPISYEVTSFDGTDTSYENFEISGLDATGSSSATSLDVKIKSNAKDIVSSTNSLKAGAYKFCVVSKDVNGTPDTPTDKTKVCVVLEVKKSQPTIVFETKDKDTEIITGSVSTGVDSTQHATHDNQDIIANGGNDHKILYTQDIGTTGIFTGLPKTKDSGGEITITTVANKTGEIVLKAHIDETENYLAADTTKTLKVVLGMNAEYVEDKMNIKAGSSEAKPSTTVPIGHISVSGGTSPFTYAFKTGANQNGSFKLDTSTGKIYVDASVGDSGLTPGEYTIEVEVTDTSSPTKQKKTVTKKITIHEADLEGVAFEDPETAGTQAGSTITRTYDPANDGGTFRTKLMETTKGSLTGTTITYSVDSASNAVLEYTKKEGEYAYFKVKKGSNASEKGTILIKANVSGGAYGATGKDITIPVNVDPYTQEIEFKQDDPYSIANTASCTSIPATKKSTYWNQDDASNKITYTSSDQNKATIIDGKLCPVKDATGTITLTATLAGDDSYKEAKSTITINLITELEGAYIEDKQNIIAGSKEAKPSSMAKIGHFTATGGTSGYTYAKKTGDNDNDKFDIKPNGDVFVSTGAGANGLLPGDYTIEVEIIDSTTPTAQTTTYKKTITVKPATLSVKFEDPDDSSKTIENVITRTYNPSTNPVGGSFHTRLVETEKDALTGAKITYSVEADPNDVLEYVDMSGDYANFKVKKASDASEKNQIKIKAHVSGGYYGTKGEDVTILVNVEKYTQEIEFKQTNPYPLPNTSECISIPATKKSTYWNQDDTSNKITYTSSDTNKIIIDEDGKICPVKDATGTITLSATLAGDDSFKEAKSTITINLIPELEGAYIEDKQNIIAGSKEAKPSTTTKIGHFTATGGTSGYTYAKKTGDNDNDKFDIKANGDVFVSTGAGANGLLPGDYTIEVEITDSTTPTTQTTTYKKTITIKPAALSVKFEDPDDSSKMIENVITRTYDPSTNPAGGSFHTRLVETTEGSLTGAKITYSVEADPNDVLEYVDMSGDYANFKVKKASDASEKNQIKIKAHVSGGYYGSEGTDITIHVNVEQYKQEIEFKQTNPYPLPNTSECTSIPATKKSSYWNKSASNEIKYTSSDITKATIDADGKVRPVKGATGSITLTAELAGDDNYTKASTTIKINLLGELTLTYTEDEPIKQAVNPDKTGDIGNAKDGAEFGNISVAGGLDKRYDIQIKSDDYANPYFAFVPITGNQRASTLKLKSGVSITADILKAGIDAGVIKQDTTNKDQYNWTIQVLPDTGEEPQEIIVHIIGADPILTFEKEVEGKLTTTYQKDGTIDLSIKRGNTVLSTGISIEGTTGYQAFIDSLANLTSDAQVNGIKIKKANCDNEDNVIVGKNIKVTPKAESSDGYKSGTGTATPVIIKKAEHPEVDFVDPDTILQSGVSSVDKGITGIEPNDAHLTITPKDPSTWEGTTFEKIDSNHDVEPSVTIKPNGYEGSVVYIVNGGGTDNYKPIVNKEIDLFFSSTGGITYKPIKINYGDDTKKVIDYITNGDKETNSYAYAPVEGTTYEDEAGNEILTLDDTTSIITTKQVGKTKVNVTRTDEKGNVITQAIPVEIVKKEITLTYESNTIYTGEELPTPAFKEPDAGVLVGNDTIADFPIPTEAAHYNGTEVLINSETTGTYDTKGNWTNDELETDVNSNYKVTIKAGKLTIKKDTVKDNWYHLENPDGKTVSRTAWHNYLVDVVLDTATGTAGTYDQISNTKTFTDTNKTRFTVTNEDENTEDVYFRIDPDSEVEHKGAITSTQTTVKIDMTNPNVTKVTGYPVNTDGLSELIHNLTFGMFFKPGVDVTIETEDPQPSGETGITVSGVNKVSYKIYKLGEKGEFDANQTPKTDEGKVDAFGKISFKINNVGNYRICAIAKDNATNTGNESCSDVNVKKVNVDIDGDGTNDFVDSDDNGCPDLNILLGKDTAGNPEDKEGNPVKLNIAEKNKNYPYMNIDSNGDGKPDLNIDTDNDGRPDLNLVIMDESLWKPKTCVVVEKLKDYSDPVEYCTGTDAKPQINVDTTGNGIPNINIDNKGDFQPHINISKNGEDAYLNITPIHIWKPDQNYNKDTLLYDSIGEDIKAITNIDSNNDGIPDLNLDFIGDGIPSVNIDTDGDGIPDLNIDGNGDGKPDYNVDTKGTGKDLENPIKLDTWEPIHIGEKDELTFGTMEIKNKDHLEDQGVIVEKPNGNFLPNFALKVEDITITAGKDIKDALAEHAQEKQIQGIYHVSLTENGERVEPGESLTVRVPVDKTLRNPSIMIQNKDGNYVAVNAQIEDGYYVFETDYLGVVAVLSDTDANPAPEDPDKPANVLPSPDSGGTSNAPDTSVQGTYTSGVGGASTGDTVHLTVFVWICGIALLILSFMYRYLRKQ